MSKLNVLLLAITLLFALSVVTSQHRTRSTYSQLERVQYQVNQLNAEYRQLQLEQSTWGAHNLVDGAARERLGMHAPDVSETLVLDPHKEASQ